MPIDSWLATNRVSLNPDAYERKVSPILKVYLHSYTFRDVPFRDACKAAHDFGYDGIELSRVHFDDNNLEDELPSAIEVAKSESVEIACVDFAGNFIDKDERVRNESIELLERNIRICSRHGIHLMNGYVGVLTGNSEDFGKNGSTLATDSHYERASEALRAVDDIATECGVTLALEIHMNTIHDTVASMRRLLEQADRSSVVATPDPGNMYATSTAERDPDSISALGGRLGYFHFKNCTYTNGKFDYSVGLADGDIDLPRYLQVMKELGYTGPVCIEHVGELEPQDVASRDLVYLEECMKRLEH